MGSTGIGETLLTAFGHMDIQDITCLGAVRFSLEFGHCKATLM